MSIPSLSERLRDVLDPVASVPTPAVGHAAVLLALTDEPQPRLWLIRRSVHLLLHGGQMAFPGGKGEADDRSLLHTALREAQEEVALVPEQVDICGALTVRRTLTGYDVAPFVGVIPVDLKLRGDPAEVAELVPIPLAEFAHRDNLFIDHIWRAGARRVLPRYQIGPIMVWGMTASFIVELANRLCGAGFEAALHEPPNFSARETASLGENR